MSTFTFGTGQQPQINRLHVVKVHSLPHAMLRTVGANSSYCNNTFFFFFFVGVDHPGEHWTVNQQVEFSSLPAGSLLLRPRLALRQHQLSFLLMA